ncbi:dna-directed rna polymerase subunit beta, partial (apicoplast) [Cystoisospora suis]
KINFKLYYKKIYEKILYLKNNYYPNYKLIFFIKNYLKKYFYNINIFNYYKFFNLTKIIKNIIYNNYDIYFINTKNFIFFNNIIQKNYFIIDSYNYKILFINKNLLKNLYFFTNNLINKNSFCKIIHKNICNLTTLNYFPFFSKKNKNPKIKTLVILYKKYLFSIFIWLWNKNWKYHLIFFNKFFIKIKNIYLNSNVKLKDITFNLIDLDNIFETKNYLYTNLISNKTGILIKNYFLYEENTLNSIWMCNLFTLKFKHIYLYSITHQKTFYEQKYSIIWGNIILTTGLYSPNIFISKIFLNYLEYYSQYKATKLAFIYTYHIIVESLIKQYYFNGIILPSVYFELLAKKMTNFIKIIYSYEIILSKENIIPFNFIVNLNYTYTLFGYPQIIYKPIILGISKSILASSGFLASLSFQETFKLLIKFSFKNMIDWMTDLKSKIIGTDIILVGTGWYRHFN